MRYCIMIEMRVLCMHFTTSYPNYFVSNLFSHIVMTV